MHEDFAGSTLGAARSLEITPHLQSFTDSLSPLNSADYYSFTVGSSSSLSLSLSGLSADAELELLDSQGKVLQSSVLPGTELESLLATLDAGQYYIKVYSGSETTTDYQLSLSATASQDTTSLQQQDSLTGFGNPSFDTGVFTVGSSGQVSLDYLFDGGGYQGELAIFSLEGMEQFYGDLNKFIEEAARRALSDSELGHVVISDATEGARFHGALPWEPDWNSGDYLGVNTFSMRPGDTFGVMLVPNGTVQQVSDNPCVEGAIRPLFSLSTTNPDDAFHVGQIADATGYGDTFIFEDLRVDTGSDYDYNDIIFRVRGATGEAVLLDDVIDQAKDWRNSDLGRNLLAYADTSINFDSPKSNQPLVGIIDTGFNANNPDIDYSRIILGRDRIDEDNNPLLQTGEGNEHGTHVLGIIGATRGNGLGIDGINDQAPIWLGRAVGSGQWAESLVEFVDAAKASGQPNAVVNLSFDLTQTNPDGSVTTRYELTPQERQTLEYARQNKVLIVAAAGNNGGTMSALGQASQEFDNIITVGSVDYRSSRADYSNFGNGLDIVAYGGTSDEPVISTVDSGADLELLTTDLDEPDDEISAAVQSTFEEIFAPESTNEASVLSVAESTSGGGELSWDDLELLQKLTPDERQAYEDAIAEIDNFISDYLNTGIDQNSLNLLEPYFAAGLDATSEFLNAFDADLVDTLLKAQEAIEETTDNADVLIETDSDLSIPLDFGLGEMAGTSVAAAKVTGAASQVWAANPSLSYLQVKEILKQTAVDLNTPGWDMETGAGLVNIAAAVELGKRTQPEVYQPKPLLSPLTWSGEGLVTPSERPVEVTEYKGKYYQWVPYTVRQGDTLWAIASRTLGNADDWSFIYQRNRYVISNPNLIYPGQQIIVPAEDPGYLQRQEEERRRQEEERRRQEEERRKQEQHQAIFNEVSRKVGGLGRLLRSYVSNGVTVYHFANGILYVQPDGRYAFYEQLKQAWKLQRDVGNVVKGVKSLYSRSKIVRQLVSSRGAAKIIYDLSRKINNFKLPKRLGFLNPNVQTRQKATRLMTKAVVGARKFLLTTKNGQSLANIAKFVTTKARPFIKGWKTFSKNLNKTLPFLPKLLKSSKSVGSGLTKVGKLFGKAAPWLNLGLTALDVATAKTPEEKRRANFKAGASLAVGVGVGIFATPAAGLLAASVTSTVIDAVYLGADLLGQGHRVDKALSDGFNAVNRTTERVGNFFSSGANWAKSFLR